MSGETKFTSSPSDLLSGEMESLVAESEMREQVHALKALQLRIQSLGYEVERIPSGLAKKTIGWCKEEWGEVKKQLELLKKFFFDPTQYDLFSAPYAVKHKKMSTGEIKAAYYKLIENLEESLEAIEKGLAGMPEKKE